MVDLPTWMVDVFAPRLAAIHPKKTYGRLQSKSQLSQQMEEKEQKTLQESGDLSTARFNKDRGVMMSLVWFNKNKGGDLYNKRAWIE